MKRTTLFVVAFCALYLLMMLALSGCMTPRQNEAVEVLRDLWARNVITQEQFEALVAALSPSTWLNDVLYLAGNLVTGGATYGAVNYSRNRARKKRGEPVAVATASSD